MDDPVLVELLVADDPRGLAGVYDAYAGRLYAYCISVLRDRDSAADAVHDTLLVARERVGQLRDPSRLRPWLYAIARNECLRTLRDRRRTGGLDEAPEMTDESADLEAGLRADEMRELVWSAAESLNPGEREVLELSVRHGLEGADLADALGVSSNHAHALLSRSRTQLERALVVLIVARTGRELCAELDGMLTGWDGRLTALLRKRLGRHVERCDICGEQRRRRVSAAALLAGVPFLTVPPALRERVLRDAGDLQLVSMWEELARRGGPYRSDGFPRPYDGRRRKLMARSAAAAAVLLLLMVGAAVVLPEPTPKTAAGAETVPGTTQLTTTGDPTTDPPSTVDTTTAPTTAPSTTATTTTPAPTTTPATLPATDPTTAAPTTTRRTTTTPPRTTTPPPTTTRPPPPPPPPSLTASSEPDGTDCPKGTWVAHLTATVTNGVANSVTATWMGANGAPTTMGMKPTRTGAWALDVVVRPATSDLAWTATAVVGRTTLTDADTALSPCPSPG